MIFKARVTETRIWGGVWYNNRFKILDRVFFLYLFGLCKRNSNLVYTSVRDWTVRGHRGSGGGETHRSKKNFCIQCLLPKWLLHSIFSFYCLKQPQFKSVWSQFEEKEQIRERLWPTSIMQQQLKLFPGCKFRNEANSKTCRRLKQLLQQKCALDKRTCRKKTEQTAFTANAL